ncbi:reverse transcriptase-like protein [Amphibacillus jilinensis]|uniref:reverse transcriptase-like protein n=1 Tax=Amphibacillus jilinensis TaxID=1216008 RepID=UPI0003116DB4|nr:reverse transcriptase-like protein [Amphibacillus jilinensis]
MKVTLHVHYQTPNHVETFFQSQQLSISEAIIIAEDFIKSGRVKSLHFEDPYDTTLSLKELKQYLEKFKQDPHDITLYFDGGFDHTNGMAGLGIVIYYYQNNKCFRLRKNARVRELVSNNEAEYAALELAIRELEGMAIHHQDITIRGDAKVVINQLLGEWPCLDTVLNQWIDRIEARLEQCHLKPSYDVIGRKLNQEADRLASQALDETYIESMVEIENDPS